MCGVTNLKVRAKTIKALEENKGVNLCELGFFVLDLTSRHKQQNKIYLSCASSKLKTSYFKGHHKESVNTTQRITENIC